MKPVLEVKGLWKSYRLGERQAGYRSLSDTIMEGCGSEEAQTRTLWALSDIEFSLQQGKRQASSGEMGQENPLCSKSLPASPHQQGVRSPCEAV